MAGWLNRQLPASTRVLVSPARRAQQTAAAMVVGTPEKNFPSLGDTLKRARRSAAQIAKTG
mgnify:CR=1 FL=1